jgi:hypothetical protein
VLAQTGDGYVMVLGRDPLETCRGQIDAFRRALEQSLERLGVTLP